MKASIKDVALRSGVSVSTVSRTLSKPNLVLPETRDTVLAAARALDYHASRSAASLKSGQTMRIALLSGSAASTWFNANAFAGLDSVLHDAGYDTSIFTMANVEKRREFFDQMPVLRNADAVVVNSFDIDSREAVRLKAVNVPIIGLNVPSNVGFDAAVSIDDRRALRMAVDHLAAIGHRRIAYVYTKADDSTGMRFSAETRLQGFMQACATHEGKRPEQIAIDTDADAVNAVLGYLDATAPAPTALCLQSDGIALPVLFRLRQYGRDIPRDLSVIGFDDVPLAKAVGLTTLGQDPYALGRAAAVRTLAAINGTPHEPRFATQPVRLMLRETTAVPHTGR